MVSARVSILSRRPFWLGIAAVIWLVAALANGRLLVTSVFVLRNNEAAGTLIAISALFAAPMLSLVAFPFPRLGLAAVSIATLVGLITLLRLPDTGLTAVAVAALRFYGPHMFIAITLFFSARARRSPGQALRPRGTSGRAESA